MITRHKLLAICAALVVMVASLTVLASCRGRDTVDHHTMLTYLEAIRSADGGYASPPQRTARLDQTYFASVVLKETGTRVDSEPHIRFVERQMSADGCFRDGGAAGATNTVNASVYAAETLANLGKPISAEMAQRCLQALRASGELDAEEDLWFGTQLLRAAGVPPSPDALARMEATISTAESAAFRAVNSGAFRVSTGICPGDTSPLETAKRQLEETLPIQTGLLPWIPALRIWATLFECAGRPGSGEPEALAAHLPRLVAMPQGLDALASLALARPRGFDSAAAGKVVIGRALPSGGFALVWPGKSNVRDTYNAFLIRLALQDPALRGDIALRDYVWGAADSATASHKLNAAAVYELATMMAFWGGSESQSGRVGGWLESVSADTLYDTALLVAAMGAIGSDAWPAGFKERSRQLFRNEEICDLAPRTQVTIGVLFEIARATDPATVIGCTLNLRQRPDDPAEAYDLALTVLGQSGVLPDYPEVFAEFASDFGGTGISPGDTIPSLAETCGRLQLEVLRAAPKDARPHLNGSLGGICMF